MARVLVLGHAEVAEALPLRDCIDVMAEVLAAHAEGELHQPLRSVSRPPSSEGFLGLMPAHRAGEQPLFALKAVCVFPGNPARGLDAHQGTVTLFDGTTGEPTAILDASAITAIRTAAVSAVATRLLAVEDASRLAILGAGVQAAAHLEAMLAVRDLEQVGSTGPRAGRHLLAHARAGGTVGAGGARRGARPGSR